MEQTERNSFTYTAPPFADIERILILFEKVINKFLFEHKGLPSDLKYHVSGADIIDVIVRVDKRRAYFHIFHGMAINECKIAGLYVYWLLKFRPILIYDERYKKETDINEEFALVLMFAALTRLGKIKGAIPIKSPYIKELLYSFRFRNISIDSMIILADTINTDTILAGMTNNI
jgi:hypothetical protein